ncbi:MAG: TnpV protein [Clostridia bacterium]|nr:TnpV protein [Clostridia bacterium]
MKQEITYTKKGDYLIPDLILPPTKDYPPLGKYGRLRKSYLMEHRKALFTHLTMGNELQEHLYQINQQAFEMMESIVKAMAKEQGVTEQLKAEDQMKWVQMMNNIRNSAEEIVLNELVYN